MIPLHKLERLPRSQRLRKIAKILIEAELRLVTRQGRPVWTELEYLVGIAKMLVNDGEFAASANTTLSEALTDLSTVFMNTEASLPRRPLNQMRHIISQEIGLQIADWDLIDAEGELSREGRKVFPGMIVYLEDIRSPFNVGSIFRSAESFGVERILVSSHCASPAHPRAARTAMGCTELVPWERLDSAALTGTVFALETGGIPLDEFVFPERGVMIVGSEELGVSPNLLVAAGRSGGRVSIPTYGAKGSLNVAVAFGIAMRAWAKARVNESGSPS